jgi:hypothetical protein
MGLVEAKSPCLQCQRYSASLSNPLRQLVVWNYRRRRTIRPAIIPSHFSLQTFLAQPAEVYINWQALLLGNSLLLSQPFRSFIHSFTPIL